MNNEVVVNIREAPKLFKCAFQDAISKQLFERLLELNRVPGWSINYGANTYQSVLDKTVLVIHYREAEEAENAAKFLETYLRDTLLFREILWKRNVNYGTLQGSRVSDVFQKELHEK